MSRSSLMALAFIFSSLVALQSYSSESESAIARMDLQTHDALIGKLAAVLPSLPNNSEQATTIKIRLGDLYSERARLKDIAAGEKNCTECKDAKKDREKAIAYYLATKRMILNHIEYLQKVNLQLANLYKLTNQTKNMEKTFKEILKDSRQFKIHSKAHLGIAEMLFQNGDYRKAAVSYNSALRRATPEDRAYVVFANHGQPTISGAAMKRYERSKRRSNRPKDFPSLHFTKISCAITQPCRHETLLHPRM